MRHFLYRSKVFFKDLFGYPHLAGESQTYEQYWQEKKKGALGVPNQFQIDRGEWIASRIQDNASIVDIGCGDGSVLFVIKKIKPVQATGLDVSQFILSFLQKNGIEAQYLDLSEANAISKIPARDHALLLEVLEHMPKPEEFLLEILSKVNRSVFISIPNTGYFQHRLRLLFGKFPLQWKAHPGEHLRFWTVCDFKWWIKSLQLTDRSTFHCYAGVPILNQIWPSLFAQGIIAEIKRK